MKRKIEDYIGQEVAVECSTKEEWDKIIDLIKPSYCKKEYYKQKPNKNTNTIHIEGIGWTSREAYVELNYVIYPASDFLEEEPKFEVGKCFLNGFYQL